MRSTLEMEAAEFRAAAHQMIDYVIDYLENIRNRSAGFQIQFHILSLSLMEESLVFNL